MIVEFTTLTSLAGNIINIWTVYNTRKQKALDRVHQNTLQKSQHKHERMLHEARIRKADNKIYIPNINQRLLERLNMEASALSSMNFDVLYESIADGYGVAFQISNNVTLAFWVSPLYPNQPPKVYIRTPTEVEKIEFAPDTWLPAYTIAEIVLALTASD